MKQHLSYKRLKENLANSLKDEHKPFIKTHAFEAMSLALYNYLISHPDYRETRKQELIHAEQNFSHLCLTQEPPDSTIEPWQRKLQSQLQ